MLNIIKELFKAKESVKPKYQKLSDDKEWWAVMKNAFTHD